VVVEVEPAPVPGLEGVGGALEQVALHDRRVFADLGPYHLEAVDRRVPVLQLFLDQTGVFAHVADLHTNKSIKLSRSRADGHLIGQGLEEGLQVGAQVGPLVVVGRARVHIRQQRAENLVALFRLQQTDAVDVIEGLVPEGTT
jgi:hypothetical protein